MVRQQKDYNTAVYCRLSKDDGKLTESSSIQTQKEMLTQYVRQQGWKLAGIYVDDGFSGLDFDRPDFKRMLEDIDNGKINCVVTKDLSRLGRNYLEAGAYLEVYFPERGVRYIALNDGVDTLDAINNDLAPFKNILNEMYARDVSRKVKSAKKTRFMQGMFLGTSAPYGYKKSPKNKHLLIIDEEVAPVVRRIFALAKQGFGIARIRQVLTDEKIMRPGAYSEISYDRYFAGNEDKRYIWSNNSVRDILRNPVYAGHLAGYKRPAISMKNQKRPCRQPEEWVIIENTHEPIISKEDFELVQRLIKSRRVNTSTGYDNIFSGLVKCADCGYAMRTSSANRRKRPEPIDNVGYFCNNYGIYGKKACTQHWIEARDLHSVVLEDIKKHARLAIKDNGKLIKKISEKISTQNKLELSNLLKEQKLYKTRLAEIDKIFTQLYEDRATKKISDRNFTVMTEKYETEQTNLDEKIKHIENKLSESQKSIEDTKSWVNLIKQYADTIELDASMLNELIEKITISEPEIIDGERLQTVSIYYRFVGCIE
ncbi:recombinase family protein, partial [Clostridium lundense]|uniref:recombinase family protein n=1 Tax=Clostridium lundense TaxID=319475 RepID=UPI000554EEE3